jgi:hypothetical protein
MMLMMMMMMMMMLMMMMMMMMMIVMIVIMTIMTMMIIMLMMIIIMDIPIELSPFLPCHAPGSVKGPLHPLSLQSMCVKLVSLKHKL